VKPSGTVVVRCLRCRHEATLSDQALAQFGLKPGAPISTFVKRLRCPRCGSGSVMANRQPGLSQRTKVISSGAIVAH
jgi:DNA-directed RNA polymerase subunit RPC12/RpoP